MKLTSQFVSGGADSRRSRRAVRSMIAAKGAASARGTLRLLDRSTPRVVGRMYDGVLVKDGLEEGASGGHRHGVMTLPVRIPDGDLDDALRWEDGAGAGAASGLADRDCGHCLDFDGQGGGGEAGDDGEGVRGCVAGGEPRGEGVAEGGA